MPISQSPRIGLKGDIMLEDLKELRRILDRFIAKYEKEAIYCVGQLEVDREDEAQEPDNNLTKEGFWRGNDIY